MSKISEMNQNRYQSKWEYNHMDYTFVHLPNMLINALIESQNSGLDRRSYFILIFGCRDKKLCSFQGDPRVLVFLVKLFGVLFLGILMSISSKHQQFESNSSKVWLISCISFIMRIGYSWTYILRDKGLNKHIAIRVNCMQYMSQLQTCFEIVWWFLIGLWCVIFSHCQMNN